MIDYSKNPSCKITFKPTPHKIYLITKQISPKVYKFYMGEEHEWSHNKDEAYIYSEREDAEKLMKTVFAHTKRILVRQAYLME
jgi:hypothetical protein